MTTALLALAWLAGIACAGWNAPGGAWLATGLVVPPALLAANRRPLPMLCLAAACAGTALLAGARWDAATAPPSSASVARLVDVGPVALYGVLADDGEERGRAQRLRVAVHDVDAGDGRRAAEGGVLVRVPAGRSYRAGDQVELYGHLTAPARLDHFDYRAYLARQGIDAQMDYPRLRVSGHRPPGGVGAWLRAARRTAGRALDRSLPQPEAALARGIIIGDRSAIPQSVTDDFNRSGTSHLIAVSGFNITLVGAMAAGALAWLVGRRPAAIVALAGISLYAVFVGMSPSVARALIMGALLIGGSVLGRPGAPLVALVIAAALMTASDPRVIDDVGFQLSFAATAGIMVLAPLIDAAGRGAVVATVGTGPAGAWAAAAWQLMSMTLAASLATIPVMLHAFGSVALAGLIANLVLVPLFPLVMITSGADALAGALVPAVSPLTGAIAWPPLALTIGVAHAAARLPGASLTLGHPHGAAVLMWYLLAAGGMVAWVRRRGPAGASRSVDVQSARLPPAWALGLALPCFVAVLAVTSLAARRPPDGRLTVRFVDAGGTTIALLTGPSGERVLIDSGPSGAALAAAVDPLLPARDHAISLIVITRATATAIGGLPDGIERYGAQAVAAPADAAGRLDEEATVPLVTVEAGSVIALARGARLEFEATPGDPGRLAVVAAWGGRRIALTPGAGGNVAPVRAAGGPPGSVAIGATAIPQLTYDVRGQGPVEVSTDGRAVRIRPARGPVLPAGARTSSEAAGPPPRTGR